MTPKWFIYFCLTLGSSIGAYLPMIWGGSLFSLTSIIMTGVGGLAGIWVAVKIGNSV